MNPCCIWNGKQVSEARHLASRCDTRDKMNHHLLDLCSFLLFALDLGKLKYLYEQCAHPGGETLL